MVVDENMTHVLGRTRGIEPLFERERIENKFAQIAQLIGGFKKYIPAQELLGRKVMLDYRNLTEEEIHHSLTDKVLLILNSKNHQPMAVEALSLYPHEHYRPNIELIQDIIFNVSFESGFNKAAEIFHYFRSIDGFVRNGEITEEQRPFEEFPSEKFKKRTIEFYKRIGCDNAQKINETLSNPKRTKELIQICEENFDKELDYVMTAFNNKEKAKVLGITGPSSSGKTSTTERLKERFEKEGRRVIVVSVDNYFKENPPKTPKGDYLFEFPESLDFALFVNDATKLFNGEEVQMTKYSFAKKERSKGEKLKLDFERGDIAIIDSHAILFHVIRNLVPEDQRFITYLKPFNMVMENDGKNRVYIDTAYTNMLRRLLRDKRKSGRDTSLETNIAHWKTVRTGDLRDGAPKIRAFPNHVINTGFPYEFGFMVNRFKEEGDLPSPNYFMERGLLSAAIYCIEAKRILSMFNSVPKEFFDYNMLPDNAIPREFLGGSKYDAK